MMDDGITLKEAVSGICHALGKTLNDVEDVLPADHTPEGGWYILFTDSTWARLTVVRND